MTGIDITQATDSLVTIQETNECGKQRIFCRKHCNLHGYTDPTAVGDSLLRDGTDPEKQGPRFTITKAPATRSTTQRQTTNPGNTAGQAPRLHKGHGIFKHDHQEKRTQSRASLRKGMVSPTDGSPGSQIFLTRQGSMPGKQS